MPGLSRHDRKRADELQSSLTTLSLDGPPALSWAMEALRELLDTDRSVAGSYEPHGEGLRLGDGWASRMPAGFLPTVDVWLRDKFDGFTAYHPLRPEPRQRNVVWDWNDVRSQVVAPSALPIFADVYTRFGLEKEAHVRTLVCDGPSLLVWMGFFQPTAFDARQRRLLARVTPALARRLAAERWLDARGSLLGMLEAALAAIPSCAFVVSASGVVREANAAGRAWLCAVPARHVVVREAALGRGDPTQFTVTHIAGGGNEAQRLLVHRGRNDAGPRVTAAASRWGFTPRQTELLGLLVDGLSNRVIAAALAISERTVETHLTAMFEKAQVEGRGEMVAAVWKV
ncbi:MAG TPA: helix-turn-helix transcriptional regulator [Polyangiaceae bacterium]